jgi:hypothetical protein
MIASFTFGAAMLISSGGCSGSIDTGGQAAQDNDGQKIYQERMKEVMAKKAATKGQNTRK